MKRPLIERLRRATGRNPWTGEPVMNSLQCEAAAEIDRLTGLIHERDQMLASYNLILRESAAREEHWKALCLAFVTPEQNKSET